jgi:P2 family phage contractile tail tube protein
MAFNVIPDKLTDYAVFDNGVEKLGTADIELPNIEYLSDTVKGPGIGGEVDTPTVAMTASMTTKINWRTINGDLTKLTAPELHSLEFRSAIAHYDDAVGKIRQVPVAVEVRGLPKTSTLGTLDIGASTGSSNELETTYLKVTVDGVEKIEINKFARVFRVNGVDYYADVRAALGL